MPEEKHNVEEENLIGLLAAALRQPIAGDVEAGRRTRWRWRPRVLAAAAAVLVAVLGMFLLVVRRPGPPTPEQPGAIQKTQGIVVYVSPELPPEIAALCEELAPVAGETMLNWNRKGASSVAATVNHFAAVSGEIPVHAAEVTNRFMDAYLNLFVNSMDRTFRIFAPSGGKKGTDQLRRVLTEADRVLALGPGTAGCSAVWCVGAWCAIPGECHLRRPEGIL